MVDSALFTARSFEFIVCGWLFFGMSGVGVAIFSLGDGRCCSCLAGCSCCRISMFPFCSASTSRHVSVFTFSHSVVFSSGNFGFERFHYRFWYACLIFIWVSLCLWLGGFVVAEFLPLSVALFAVFDGLVSTAN